MCLFVYYAYVSVIYSSEIWTVLFMADRKLQLFIRDGNVPASNCHLYQILSKKIFEICETFGGKKLSLQVKGIDDMGKEAAIWTTQR